MGAYLCIASNDVPPTVSKRITLNVNCELSRIYLTEKIMNLIDFSRPGNVGTKSIAWIFLWGDSGGRVPG